MQASTHWTCDRMRSDAAESYASTHWNEGRIIGKLLCWNGSYFSSVSEAVLVFASHGLGAGLHGIPKCSFM